jgi:PhoPQ-activated pathogenicity-related protein
LFLNGTNDPAYPLDSCQKSYRLVPGPVDLRIQLNMPHGHPDGWNPQEIGLYVDSVLKDGEPLPKLSPMKTDNGRITTECTAAKPIVKAQLLYTHDTGPWQQRSWTVTDATIHGKTIQADLPAARPIVYYLNVTDERGAMVSTAHATLP